MKNKIQRAILAFIALFLIGFSAFTLSQTNNDKWWPHPLWGEGDQAGASNWNTQEQVLSALTRVKSGKVYELGHMYERGMPLVGNRTYNMFLPNVPTAGPFGENNVVFNDEFLATEIGQVGTQFDGPGHPGRRITLPNGHTTEVFYNGYTTEDIASPYGLLKLGVENVKPYFNRGVLFDVAGYKGVDKLPEGYEVTVADIKGVMRKQGIKDADIQPGDVLLFNFGWWRYWPKPNPVSGNVPFAGRELVNWIIAKQPSMVGSDTNLDGPEMLVHTELTMKHGIFNFELMKFDTLLEDNVYEFLFVFAPLRLKGATGSPGRPIAIR